MQLDIEIVTAILGFTGAFIVKEAWDYIKRRSQKDKESVADVLEKNTESLIKLNLTIVELRLRIDHLSEKLAPLPKLQSDINEAHNKIRDVNTRIEIRKNGV